MVHPSKVVRVEQAVELIIARQSQVDCPGCHQLPFVDLIGSKEIVDSFDAGSPRVAIDGEYVSAT